MNDVENKIDKMHVNRDTFFNTTEHYIYITPVNNLNRTVLNKNLVNVVEQNNMWQNIDVLVSTNYCFHKNIFRPLTSKHF